MKLYPYREAIKNLIFGYYFDQFRNFYLSFMNYNLLCLPNLVTMLHSYPKKGIKLIFIPLLCLSLNMNMICFCPNWIQ